MKQIPKIGIHNPHMNYYNILTNIPRTLRKNISIGFSTKIYIERERERDREREREREKRRERESLDFYISTQ